MRMSESKQDRLISDMRSLDPLIRHLRAHVAELRRLEAEGSEPAELAEHKGLIARLQGQLALAVRDPS
jgi:hypothetical protein